MRPILDVATDLGFSTEDLMVYGEYMAKLRLQAMFRRAGC